MPSAKLSRLVELLRERAPRPGTSVETQRVDLEAAVARMPVPDEVARQPVEAGGVPAEWLVPPGAEDAPVVVHLHGGGYVTGSPATVRPMAAQLALAARARVLTIDYRLAPEHPHPAAVEDTVAAYRWLLEDGHDPTRLALAGDSAGGGLAVAALVALRDRGIPLPAAAVCLSPWSDLTLPGASVDGNAASDPQVQRWMLSEMAAHYLAGGDPRAPLASPRYADLSGLPPLLIHAGAAEALVDDARALAAAAEAAGVPTTLECWEGMIHVWHSVAPVLPEAVEGLARVAAWLEERWTEAAGARR